MHRKYDNERLRYIPPHHRQRDGDLPSLLDKSACNAFRASVLQDRRLQSGIFGDMIVHCMQSKRFSKQLTPEDWMNIKLRIDNTPYNVIPPFEELSAIPMELMRDRVFTADMAIRGKIEYTELLRNNNNGFR